MQLTVFGASGGTGTQVVRQAVAAGHDVTAVVRDPSRLAVPAGDRLTVLVADVLDSGAITPPVTGADAVVSALGPRRDAPPTICSTGIRSILRAMSAAGTRRLLTVSASAAYIDADDDLINRIVVKPILQRVLRDSLADTRRADDEVRASDTEWTILRPPRLTDKGHRRYRTAADRNVGRTISRADLAREILAAAADRDTIGHVVGIGY